MKVWHGVVAASDSVRQLKEREYEVRFLNFFSKHGLKMRDFAMTAVKKYLFCLSGMKMSKAKCGLPNSSVS